MNMLTVMTSYTTLQTEQLDYLVSESVEALEVCVLTMSQFRQLWYSADQRLSTIHNIAKSHGQRHQKWHYCRSGCGYLLCIILILVSTNSYVLCIVLVIVFPNHTTCLHSLLSH